MIFCRYWGTSVTTQGALAMSQRVKQCFDLWTISLQMVRQSRPGGSRTAACPSRKIGQWIISMPKALKDIGAVADDLEYLGCLCLLRTTENCIRSSSIGWSFDGLGRFILGLPGCYHLCVMFPTKAILELGCAGLRSLEFIEMLSAAEFQLWESSVAHCAIRGKDIVYVPYGWSPLLIGLKSSEGESTPNHSNMALTWSLVSKILIDEMAVPERTLMVRPASR